MGKGIWISDYKKTLNNDSKLDDSDDDSREMLKKELKFVDNISKLDKFKAQ